MLSYNFSFDRTNSKDATEFKKVVHTSVFLCNATNMMMNFYMIKVSPSCYLPNWKSSGQYHSTIKSKNPFSANLSDIQNLWRQDHVSGEISINPLYIHYKAIDSRWRSMFYLPFYQFHMCWKFLIKKNFKNSKRLTNHFFLCLYHNL